ARQQRGNQVSVGLAGASAGFGDQYAAVGDRLLDRAGQRLLSMPDRETGDLVREGTITTQRRDRIDRLVAERLEGTGGCGGQRIHDDKYDGCRLRYPMETDPG